MKPLCAKKVNSKSEIDNLKEVTLWKNLDQLWRSLLRPTGI